jgi:hypothetical protein
MLRNQKALELPLEQEQSFTFQADSPNRALEDCFLFKWLQFSPTKSVFQLLIQKQENVDNPVGKNF